MMEENEQELEYCDQLNFADRTGIIKLMEERKLKKYVIGWFRDKARLSLFDL